MQIKIFKPYNKIAIIPKIMIPLHEMRDNFEDRIYVKMEERFYRDLTFLELSINKDFLLTELKWYENYLEKLHANT